MSVFYPFRDFGPYRERVKPPARNQTSRPTGVRLSLALTAATALVAGLVAGPSPAAAEAAPVAPSTDDVKLKVVSYNIRADRTTSQFRDAVLAVAPRAHLMGLQEVNGKPKEGVLADLDGWDYYRYNDGDTGSGQTPILWRPSRFDFDSGRGAFLAAGRWLDRDGQMVNDKYAHVVRLTDRLTGEDISVINVHLPSGALKGGQPRLDRPLTYAMYLECVVALELLTAFEQLWWGDVYVMGDFNIGWVADSRSRHLEHPFKAMRRLGLRASWETDHPAKRGTIGTALLDQVYSSIPAARAKVAFDVKYSDHFPAIAVYKLPLG